MKIAVVGCGAMGSVYAGRLASARHEVLVIDTWVEHISAIAEHGLLVSGPGDDIRVRVQAHTTPPQEPVDLVVLAVKAANVESASAQARPLLGPKTIVLTIQNGLGSADVVAAQIGADRVAVGIASGFGASVTRPGQVHHNAMRALRFGSYGGLDQSEIERVASAWRLGGFDAKAVSDIAAMQWEKLICNVAYSAPCALTGLTVGEVMDDEHVGPVSRAAAKEAWEIARALDVGLSLTDPVGLVRDFGAQMPAAKPSALLDHEARRISEIMFINGAVPREAAKVGREAPVNATLTALVRARETSWANDQSA
jgi:2-dehydropantoate 2-reductase